MNPHWKYLKYVVKHKFFVFKAGLQTQAPLLRLLIHDWTKFLPCEWVPYVDKFNRVEEIAANEKFREQVDKGVRFVHPGSAYLRFLWTARFRDAVDAAFDRAWLHHQHWNPHHWQHWCLLDDSPSEPSGKPKLLKMPEHFAREMVADWMGAGRAIHGSWDIKPWYVRNVTNIKLHPETRAFVEDLIFGADHGLIGSSTSNGATAGITA